MVRGIDLSKSGLGYRRSRPSVSHRAAFGWSCRRRRLLLGSPQGTEGTKLGERGGQAEQGMTMERRGLNRYLRQRCGCLYLVLARLSTPYGVAIHHSSQRQVLQSRFQAQEAYDSILCISLVFSNRVESTGTKSDRFWSPEQRGGTSIFTRHGYLILYIVSN